MKKAVIVLSLALILLSCTLDDTTIVNTSREEVRVTFRHTGPFYLEPGAPPISIKTVAGMSISYTPEEWVTVTHNERRSIIVFANRESFPLVVKNYSSGRVRFSVEGHLVRMPNDACVDCDCRDEKSYIFVDGAPAVSSAASGPLLFIYTRYPQFIAVSYPIGHLMLINSVFAFDSVSGTSRFVVSIKPPPMPVSGGANSP